MNPLFVRYSVICQWLCGCLVWLLVPSSTYARMHTPDTLVPKYTLQERSKYEVNGVVFVRNERKRGAKQKEAIESVTVVAYQVTRNEAGEVAELVLADPAYSVVTNAQGSFSFEFYGNVEYAVHCIKRGYRSEPIFFGKKKVAKGERISIEIELFAGQSTVLEGICLSEKGKIPIPNTRITLTEIASGVRMQLLSDQQGSFRFPLKAGQDYMLSTNNQNFFAQQPKKIMASSGEEAMSETVWLREIVVGQVLTIETPTFFLNDYHLTKEGTNTLEQLLPILLQNPNVHFELGVHTDSRGNDAYNLALTQKRAEETVSYLIEKGVDPANLVAKGYGEQHIRNHCQNGVRCSNQGHLVNRRMELKVLGFIE